MNDPHDIIDTTTSRTAGIDFCGYGSCDKAPGHDGIHRCRCGKPVDELHTGCAWHTAGGRP